MKKGILSIGVMLLSVFLCGCKEKIDLNSYLDIDVDGYDTMGTASFSIDYEDIYEDYEEIFDKGAKGEFEELLEEFGIELLLEEAISGELSESSGLSNGDEIEFEWDIDAGDIEENFKVKFVYENVTEKVKGLEEGTIFHPFDELQVTFTGTAPNGELELEENFSVSGLRAKADKEYGLKNGDVVTVTLQGRYGDDVYDVCFAEGMIPSETSKQYTVAGLPAYIEKLSEIPKSTIDEMDRQVRDEVTAMVNGWAEKDSLANMEYLGAYLLIAKPEITVSGSQNQLILVYRNSVKNTEGEFAYYYYISYSDILKNADGTLNCNLANYTIPKTGGWFSTGTTFTHGSYTYTGYETLEGLYDTLVKAYVAGYNSETDITDEKWEDCKKQFVAEKSTYVCNRIIAGAAATEELAGSYYTDEILKEAKSLAATYYEQEKLYAKAYALFGEIGNAEKAKEMVALIYEEAATLSVKEAYERISVIAEADRDAEKTALIEEAYLMGQFADAEVGDVVLFGDYEQDNNKDNSVEAIEWIVVEKSDTEVKLLSKSVLAVMGYALNDVRWEMSDVRAFLNKDFITGAFNTQEQEVLAVNTVKAEKNPQPKYYDGDPGVDTEDKAYILSYSEYEKYKNVNGVTDYVASATAQQKSYWCYTWLRNPGGYVNGSMALILQSGLKGVANLNQNKMFGTSLPAGVRPVITIRIAAETVEENMDEVTVDNQAVTE
ncbi:MAG: hypothetical protein IKT67_11225 [Lachnospiraceae bacterium]|nr:hypothetical protein [Lachnospiraceae bacterium]